MSPVYRRLSPAAAIVGESGHVVGVDLAENQLARARTKAAERGLQNADFRQEDMTELDYADNSFDAVVCVFGIFFVPDMEAQINKLWRMTKPGGKLAITTWGPDLFEPMSSHFKAAITQARSDLVSIYRPWQRLTVPSGVEQLLIDGGAENVTTAVETGEQTLVPLGVSSSTDSSSSQVAAPLTDR